MAILKRRNEPQPKRQGNNNREFYQSARWHKLSKYFRHQNPLCAECLSKGITKGSECVDHILPINQGGDVWNINNLQALCFSCHNRKTVMETKHQSCIINVVYGPPCSGKSTIINQRKKSGDIVLDADILAQSIFNMSTKDYRMRTKEMSVLLLKSRDGIIKALFNDNVTIWIPTTYLSGIFTSIKYNKIDNLITKEQCIERLNASDRINKDHQIQAINEWFEKNISPNNIL